MIGTRIARALHKNHTSWALGCLGALYWRVQGDAPNAINCLRMALMNASLNNKHIPLLSLANILHKAGSINDALEIALAALESSPETVVIHFSIGNMYAAKVRTTEEVLHTMKIYCSAWVVWTTCTRGCVYNSTLDCTQLPKVWKPCFFDSLQFLLSPGSEATPCFLAIIDVFPYLIIINKVKIMYLLHSTLWLGCKVVRKSLFHITYIISINKIRNILLPGGGLVISWLWIKGKFYFLLGPVKIIIDMF